MQRIDIGSIILHINNTTLLNKAKQAKHFYCSRAFTGFISLKSV